MLAAARLLALAEDDLAEPAGEGRGGAQLRQAGVRADERLLGRVLGQVEVAQQGIGVPHGHVLEAAHDGFVRVQVAGAGAVDQGIEVGRAGFGRPGFRRTGDDAHAAAPRRRRSAGICCRSFSRACASAVLPWASVALMSAPASSRSSVTATQSSRWEAFMMSGVKP